MDFGFSTAFGFFDIVFPLIFILVIGIFIVAAVRGIAQWNQNNHAPRLSVHALVVGKRTEVSHHHSGTDNMQMHSFTSYYVTFQVDSGDRMELQVTGREYGMLAEGDDGELTFQGTRYLGFTRTAL